MSQTLDKKSTGHPVISSASKLTNGLQHTKTPTYANWVPGLEILGHEHDELVIGIKITRSAKGKEDFMTQQFTVKNFRDARTRRDGFAEYSGSDLKKLDLGGKMQGQILDSANTAARTEFQERFDGKLGPLVTGGVLQKRIDTSKKLLNISKATGMIALIPEMESHLTKVAVENSFPDDATAVFCVGSTDGHIMSRNDVHFFPNVGIKGKSAAAALGEIIHFLKTIPATFRTLWLGGSFTFLFLGDDNNPLAHNELKGSNVSYTFTDKKLLIELLEKQYANGDAVQRHNCTLLIGVLKHCSNIENIVIGSRR